MRNLRTIHDVKKAYREQNNTAAEAVDSLPPNYEPEGRQFDSVRAHHKNQ